MRRDLRSVDFSGYVARVHRARTALDLGLLDLSDGSIEPLIVRVKLWQGNYEDRHPSQRPVAG